MSKARAAALILGLGSCALLATPLSAQETRGEPLALRTDGAWNALRVTLRDGRQATFARGDIAGVEYRYPVIARGPGPSPIGTWDWVQGQRLVIQRDGTCQVYLNGQKINDCQWVGLGDGRYRLTHRSGGFVDTITVSPDANTLTGVNNSGYALHGSRVGAAPQPPPQARLPGRWSWVSGQMLVIGGDGTCQVYLNGQKINDCQWVSLGDGRYRLTHRSGGFVDTVTLSPDANTLTGVNNLGYALRGTRQ